MNRGSRPALTDFEVQPSHEAGARDPELVCSWCDVTLCVLAENTKLPDLLIAADEHECEEARNG